MDLTNVLTFKYPGAQFFLMGNEYEGLDWHDKKIPKPTWDEIVEASLEFDNHLKKTEYKRLRAVAYPSIQDQLDLIYHNGIEGWSEHILNVKKKYPNPNKKTKERRLMSNLQVHDEISSLNAKIDALEKKIATSQHSHYVEMGDVKNAMCAIKGFMMEIPNIQKTLGDIQAQLSNTNPGHLPD